MTWNEGKTYCERRGKSFGIQPGSYNEDVQRGLAKWRDEQRKPEFFKL